MCGHNRRITIGERGAIHARTHAITAGTISTEAGARDRTAIGINDRPTTDRHLILRPTNDRQPRPTDGNRYQATDDALLSAAPSILRWIQPTNTTTAGMQGNLPDYAKRKTA